jgi:hypothetical protein
MPHGREHAFDGVGRAQVILMLGREVIEGQQRVAVLGEAFDRSAVPGAVFLAAVVTSEGNMVRKVGWVHFARHNRRTRSL